MSPVMSYLNDFRGLVRLLCNHCILCKCISKSPGNISIQETLKCVHLGTDLILKSILSIKSFNLLFLSPLLTPQVQGQ